MEKIVVNRNQSDRRAELTYDRSPYRKLVYLILILGSIWELIGCKPAMVPSNANLQGLDMTVSQLDSFSPPAIAKIVLRQEAERLLLAYAQQRDREAQASQVAKTCQADGTSEHLNTGGSFVPLALTQRMHAMMSDLEDLHVEVHALEVDLDGKLIMVCYQNQLWDQFIDRYLEFLRAAPENSFVVTWAANALDCAFWCGRDAEVRDALEHIIRFSEHTKTAVRLAAVLSEWRPEDARALRARHE